MKSFAVLLGTFISLSAVEATLLYYSDVPKTGYSVKYDNRSFIINGKRTLLLSGAVHYRRVVTGEWEHIFKEMINDGLNMVQTYIFWNIHEPRRGDPYDFNGNKNFTRFVELAGNEGLFVNLRIGPFVESEWDYGGIPHWINEIPDMVVRANNTAWKKEMARFFKDIVEISKPYFADNGGPIIIGQVENEFHYNQDQAYVDWCGELVKELNVGIPFGMCNGFSANYTINTHNGKDGVSYAEQHSTLYPGQPLAWTEDAGWFQEWELPPFTPEHSDNRSAEDVSAGIAKWFARGGAHHNYYMWYGGANYGRKSAGSCITNMYAAGTNLQFDGLYNEPKKSHLSRLHKLLGVYSDILLNHPSQVNNKTVVLVLNSTTNKFEPATGQYAFVYSTTGTSGVAFVENIQKEAHVMFMSNYYIIPSYSVSLIDLTSKAVLFNSATVETNGIPTQRVYTTVFEKLNWKVWPEPILTDSNMNYVVGGYPLEQLYLTNDLTDYLFYQTTVSVQGGKGLIVKIDSQVANSFVVYIDGIFQSRTDKCGSHFDMGSMTYNLQVDIPDNREHELTLLSISLGVGSRTLPGFYSFKGITDRVTLNDKDITEGQWIHRQYLQGELLEIYSEKGMDKVNWVNNSKSITGKSPVWYSFTFDLPAIKPGYTLLLDLQGMGRGYFFLNGFNMGRYWLNMVGGEYVQRYYFLPQSMLKEKVNMLTLIEDMGATSPESVQFVQSTMSV